MIFDMGGILHPTPFEELPQLAAARGWPIDAFPRGPFSPGADEAYGRMDRGELREFEYWAAASGRLAQQGIEFDIHDLVDWSGRDRLEVVELIRELARRYRMALLTNDATDWLGPGWRSTWWLRDQFEVTIDAAEEGLRKPAPEIYLRTAAALGLPPDRCVFIDDLTVNVEGARAVGMQAFWFDVTQPEASVESLRSLLLDTRDPGGETHGHRVGGGQPEVELIWFAGCPNHEAARDLLREVVGQAAPGLAIRDIDATDPSVAERVRFPGSPTIRVNGLDVQPGFADPGDYTPRCRVYWTDDGLKGIPAREWIEAALSAAVAESP